MENSESGKGQSANPRRQKRRAEYRKNIRRQTERARRNMRYSMFLVAVFVVIFSVRIVQLLYGLSITDHRKYTEMAANTHTERYPVYSTRGNILAADGTELAISTYTYTVGLTPGVFGPSKSSNLTQAEVEEEFCRILELDVLQFRKDLLEYKDRAYIQVRRSISGELNDELTKFLTESSVSGVRRDANQARYYPQGELGSQIIGFANVRDDNLAGVTGIESYYNSELAGQAGYVYREVDNYYGQPLPGSSSADVPSTPGSTLGLTMQPDLQRLVQSMVEELSISLGARNGAQVIVMNPDTGAVLAMSNENNYDLNNPTAAPHNIAPEDWDPNNNKEQQDYMTGTVWTSRAIRYPHEIGSIIKPFVLSSALDEGVIDKDTLLSDEPIYISGWDYAISSYDGVNRGMLTPAESIWDSRNPPFVRLAQMMGITTFYDYIQALGLRDKTGLDLPNETIGLFHQNPQEIDMAVTAFGEQVTITPMQIANDYAMLANGGMLMQPYLVQKYYDAEGNVVKETAPQQIRRVISEQSAAEVRDMMIGVGRYGTGSRAYVPGLEAGYKTGTSSRAVDGSETDNSFTVSAVILLPADDPKYVIYVSAYDVAGRLGRGTQVMAREIADFLADRDNLPVQYKAFDYNYIYRDRFPDSVIGLDREEASLQVMDASFWPVQADTLKAGATVQSQYPTAGQNIGYNGKIWLSDQAGALPEKRVILPDFTGLTVEEALREARRLNLNLSFDGANRAGVCTSMTVIDADLAGGDAPGANVREYTLVNLRYDGDDAPGPQVDDSMVPGYSNGLGWNYVP